jgi:magnesium-transporting ATPase (P-type)
VCLSFPSPQTNFAIITTLLFINAVIGFLEEAKAESAVDALKSTLALRCRIVREGRLIETQARELVPGDVIALRGGDVVSADAVVLPALRKSDEWKGLSVVNNRVVFHIERKKQQAAAQQEEEEARWQQAELTVDQSALTGESLPVRKRPGDLLYSSSLIKGGQAKALVIRTGQQTFVGRAANLIAITTEAGHFQQVIARIGNFLILITVFMVAVIFVVGVAAEHHRVPRQLQDCLVICIASIPVGLPTVLSVTMAVGAQQLAARQVIVKRLTAVEEMAGMDILCSDKVSRSQHTALPCCWYPSSPLIPSLFLLYLRPGR